MRQPLKLLFSRFRLGPHEAEDITQSALTILVRDWTLIDNPRGYLLATVRRQISHHFRRLAAEKLEQLDEHLRELTSENPAIGLDRRLDALRLLSRLPPSVRQVALLHYGGGYTHQEIAAALGQPEPAVRQLLSRGLRRLRRELEASPAPAAR
jgi:RNA polymerase sigma-70 factor (ECF subfamily)